MKFQVIAFDMDGTLLNSKKELSVKSINAIEKLKKQGCSIILNSDRRLSGLIDYAEKLKLGTNDYLICRNGLYIYNGDRQLISKQGFLKVSDIKSISDYSRNGRISFFTEKIDYSCSFSKTRSLRKRIKTILNMRIRRQELLSPENRKKSIAQDELKLLCKIEIEKARLDCKDVKKLSEKYSVYRVADYPKMSDVFSRQVNKYLALVQLCEKGFISSMDDVLYFGDDTNDMDCFKNLKYCIAMGNARKEIKMLAWKITDDCDNDGISKAISLLEKQ